MSPLFKFQKEYRSLFFVRLASFLVVVLVLMFAMLSGLLPALANDGGVVAQQMPYQQLGDQIAWTGPLTPLPLWAQAAVASAAVAGAYFFVPPAMAVLIRRLRTNSDDF